MKNDRPRAASGCKWRTLNKRATTGERGRVIHRGPACAVASITGPLNRFARGGMVRPARRYHTLSGAVRRRLRLHTWAAIPTARPPSTR